MKHYRVKKDTFMWKTGAIISNAANDGQYIAIEDIWNAVPTIHGEYISARIIEHPDNSDFLERVYPDTLKGKIYHTKDDLLKVYSTTFKK